MANVDRGSCATSGLLLGSLEPHPLGIPLLLLPWLHTHLLWWQKLAHLPTLLHLAFLPKHLAPTTHSISLSQGPFITAVSHRPAEVSSNKGVYCGLRSEQLLVPYPSPPSPALPIVCLNSSALSQALLLLGP